VTTSPALSVVVIGRNEGQRLARCLDSIHSIRGIAGEIEVIYADSGSTDGSPQLASATGARVVEPRSDRPTAALGRNAGWAIAKAPYILFLDGDTILHPDFTRHALDALTADRTIAADWGHRREIHPEQSVYNRILDLDWVFAPGFTDYCGGDVLMRREALEAVGGYDATLIAGEEPELCRRMRTKGYRILHIDTPMTGHDLAMTRFGQYWKRALRAGHAYAEVSSRFRNTPDPLWQPQRKQNFLRGGFWALSLLTSIAAGILWRSFLPVALWMGLLLLLSIRSAWHARWKSAPGFTLFLYGIHSHLQQIPIVIGQLQFDLNARHGRRQKLIEYKGNA
jgi:cellulose synthase/poly-beta-1,6-N-acetylglucosamine synthase-like glycosyltransferase